MAMESQGSEATAAANAPTNSMSETASVQTVEIETAPSTKQTVEVTVTTETTIATETVITEASSSSSEMTSTTTMTTASSTASEPAKPKKFYGLGNYLPKVPNLLMKKDDKQMPPPPQPTTSSTRGSNHSDENGGSASDASDARTRGVSTDQSSSSFASTFVRRISNFRAQPSSSIPESPRDSIDGSMPQQQQQQQSLVSVSGTGLPSPHGDVNGKPRRGACVATKYGTGVVLDIRDDGFYIVQLVPKSIAYLQEDLIIREIKSVVGERVKTRWGLATVEQYYVDEDMYSIALDWRWDDDHVWRMKATTKKFEKIPKGNSIVQHTKNKIFEGYSTIRESASFGYANVAAKINTTASTYKTRTPQQQAIPPQNENLGKALTPYGVCTVLQVRSDQFFVVKTKCGATAYLNADSVKLLHRRTNFAIGDRVKTPYGMGEVVAYRDEDEMYEVKLDFNASIGSLPPMLYISDLHAEAMLIPATSGGANYTRLSSIFTMTRNSVYSASATVKASASGGLNTLSTVKSKVSTMAAMKMTKLKFQKGERVITSFGSGFISEVRPLERIYEVQLRRLKFHGYFHESALHHFPYERVTHFIVDGKTIPAPDVPKNAPEHKRRHIINEAIRHARVGK